MLSCYTTNLLGHLRRDTAGIDEEFIRAIKLSVRIDLDDSDLEFTQHSRIGPQLGYRSADTWKAAREGLLHELEQCDDVIAVANTRNLPWCPACKLEDVPHWIRICEQRNFQWRVIDEFSAVLPQGEQFPYDCWVNDDELAAMLTPLPPLSSELRSRDIHALGETSITPTYNTYRWLGRGIDDRAEHVGIWISGNDALLYLAKRFAHEPGLLRRYNQDLWAASRHHQYRFASDSALAAAWGELPRTLNFALQSAERGRPRPTLIEQAFENISSLTIALEETSQCRM